MVKNGSVTPKVIGDAVAAAAARWRSRASASSCQKQSPNATPKASERDDDPVAQLVEVLDERQTFLEA